MQFNKRGISPVIATTVLVIIAIVLAVIIFLWARGLLGEEAQKFEDPVANACDIIDFDVEAFTNDECNVANGGLETCLHIVNRGRVPIYGVEVLKKDAASGSTSTSQSYFQGTTGGGRRTIDTGETSKTHLTDTTLAVDNTIVVIPVILGEKGAEKVPHTCSNEQGLEIKIEAA